MNPLHITPDELGVAVLATLSLLAISGYALYELRYNRTPELDPDG